MSMDIFRDRKFKILLLSGFYLAWGSLLWWSVSANGLGTSRDSAEYLFTSLSLVRGNGFITFSGSAYVLWPPLYPALLALVQMVIGSDPLVAALVLQLFIYVWLAVLIWRLFSRIFPSNFWLAFLGNLFSMTGISLTLLFQAVGSDYLFIALTLSMIELCEAYTKDNRVQTIWMMVLVSALSMLQRYIGITLMLTGAWVIFFHSRTTIWERFKRSALIGLSATAPGIWALTLPPQALVRGGASSLVENIYWYTYSILSWFIPENELYGHPVRLQYGLWGMWVAVFACVIILIKFRARESVGVSAIRPLFLFAVIYSVVLLAIASLSYFNRLDSRFASPIYIPLVVLASCMVESLLGLGCMKYKPIRWIATVLIFSMLLVVLGLSGYQSMVAIRMHHENGGGYTSRVWRNNPMLKYWQANLPNEDALVFSNYPSGLALYGWHEVLPSPRRTLNPNVNATVIPLETYLPQFEQDKEIYLVWVEPNDYTHVYSVDDLSSILNMELLFKNEGGSIYKVTSVLRK